MNKITYFMRLHCYTYCNFRFEFSTLRENKNSMHEFINNCEQKGARYDVMQARDNKR